MSACCNVHGCIGVVIGRDTKWIPGPLHFTYHSRYTYLIFATAPRCITSIVLVWCSHLLTTYFTHHIFHSPHIHIPVFPDIFPSTHLCINDYINQYTSAILLSSLAELLSHSASYNPFEVLHLDHIGPLTDDAHGKEYIPDGLSCSPPSRRQCRSCSIILVDLEAPKSFIPTKDLHFIMS